MSACSTSRDCNEKLLKNDLKHLDEYFNLHRAITSLLQHHRISELRGISNTLDERFTKLDKILSP